LEGVRKRRSNPGSRLTLISFLKPFVRWWEALERGGKEEEKKKKKKSSREREGKKKRES